MTFDLTPEQMRRAQINGTKRKRRSFVRESVIHALRSGPKLLHEIAADTGRSGQVLAPSLAAMLETRQIIVIGTAEQAGRESFRRRDSRMYALPGTPVLPKLKPVSATERVKNIAPGWYRPGFGPELHRDFREHQRLAEMVRR